MPTRNPSHPHDPPEETQLHAIVCCDAFTFQTGPEPRAAHCHWCQNTRDLEDVTVLTTTYDATTPDAETGAKLELRHRYQDNDHDTTPPTGDTWGVLVCACGSAWIQADIQTITETTCPRCGKRRPPTSNGRGTSFKSKVFEDRAKAVDWRSKYLAEEADWSDTYEKHTLAFVQYGSGTATDYGAGTHDLDDQVEHIHDRFEEDDYLRDDRALAFARSILPDLNDRFNDALSADTHRERYESWADAVAGRVGDDDPLPHPENARIVPESEFAAPNSEGSVGFTASSQFQLTPTVRVTETRFSAETDPVGLWKPSRFLKELVSHDFFRTYLAAAHDLTKGRTRRDAIDCLVDAGLTPFDPDPETGRDDSFATLVVEALQECHAAATGEIHGEAYPDPGDDVAFGEVLPGVNRPIRKSPDWWEPATYTLYRSLNRLLYSNALNPKTAGLPRVRAALRVFEATNTVTPVVEVGIGDRFFQNENTDQRRDVLEILNTLATGCQVVVATTRLGARKLHRLHQGSIPRRVTESLNPSMSTLPPDAKDAIRAARDRIDHGSALDRVMRSLAEETSETIAYDLLEHQHGYSRAYVRKLASRLSDLGLVDSVTDYREQRVLILTPLGRKYLNVIPHQETFSHYNSPNPERDTDPTEGDSESVTEGGSSSEDSRETPNRHEGTTPPSPPTPGDGDPPASTGETAHQRESARDDDTEEAMAGHVTRERPGRSGYVSVERLGLRDAVAATAATQPGEFRLLDRDTSFFQRRGEPDSRIPAARYLPDQQAFVVAVAPKNMLELHVSLARALASPTTFDRILTPEVLEDILDDVPSIIMQRARNIGLSTDRLENPDEIPAFISDWESRLCDLLSMYRDAKDENAPQDRVNRLRGTIIRTAKGLAGSLIHLLAFTDVEIVREVRVPDAIRDWGTPRSTSSTEKDDRRRAFLESLAKQAAIESQYGHFVPYRALYEQNEDKRNSSIMPSVDHTQPYGEYIGSTLLVGPGITDWEPDLRAALENPGPVHEDAPDLNVRHHIRTSASRRHISMALREILEQKNLSLTREASLLFTSLVGNEYATVAAVFDALKPSQKQPGREIRSVELRRALTELSPRELLPEHSGRALKDVLHALLRVDEWVSTSELCAEAGISEKTFRETVRDQLKRAGLLAGDGHGWRLTLHFTDERGYTSRFQYPWPLHTRPETGDLPPLEQRLTHDVLWSAAQSLPEPPDRYATPGDPLADILYHPPPPGTIDRLDGEYPGFRLLATIAEPLGQPHDGAWTKQEVDMGPRILQQPRLT